MALLYRCCDLGWAWQLQVLLAAGDLRQLSIGPALRAQLELLPIRNPILDSLQFIGIATSFREFLLCVGKLAGIEDNLWKAQSHATLESMFPVAVT